MDTEKDMESLTGPFLVKVQSINLPSLDFKPGPVLGRIKKITFIEASNQLLLVGCLSGTVFVLSRETLQFKFMIPFKGGRVSCMALAKDESDLAIGSNRGNVSLYRIAPLAEAHWENQSLVENSHPAFKELCNINLQAQNEIVDIQWSSNGRFLFIGDSKGLVSQANVGSLEEFPRARMSSKVILEVNNRILDMTCAFPYLGVVTCDEAFLCHIEHEDFTRIKIKDAQTSPSGISLVGKSHDLSLIVGEFNQGRLFQCDLNGEVIKYSHISFHSKTSSIPQVPFDPTTVSKVDNDSSKATQDLTNVSILKDKLGIKWLRKLEVTEQGFLISISNNPQHDKDKLVIINPHSMKILAWSKGFGKIHSVKVVLNYLFIWHGEQVEVLAVTSFDSYGEQLFTAGLTNLLEEWLSHALKIIGVEGKDVEKNTQVILRNMIKSKNLEFCHFISERISFPLEEEPEGSQKSPLPSALLKLSISFQNFKSESTRNESIVAQMLKWIKSLKGFYSDLEASLPELQSESNLMKILAEAKTFLHQPQLVTLQEDLMLRGGKLKEEIEVFLCWAIRKLLNCKPERNSHEEDVEPLFFSALASHPLVLAWFTILNVTKEQIIFDGLFADFLLLALPMSKSMFQISFQPPIEFFTWFVLVLLTSGRENEEEVLPLRDPYMTLFLQPEPKFNYGEDFFSKVSLYLLGSNDEWKRIKNLSSCLHHFVSTIYLLNWKEEGSQGLLLAFLASFPANHFPRADIIKKIHGLCKGNKILFGLFRKAALAQETDLSLCFCNLPRVYGGTKRVSLYQKAIDDGLIQLFEEENPNESCEEVAHFALRRSNFLYAFLGKGKLREEEQAELIVRTSACELLPNFGFSIEKFKLLVEKRNKLVDKMRKRETRLACEECSEDLHVLPSFEVLSMDCLGAWALHFMTLEKFGTLFEKLKFNHPGVFSLEFYLLAGEMRNKKVLELGQREPASNKSKPLEEIQRVSHVIPFCDKLHANPNNLSILYENGM